MLTTVLVFTEVSSKFNSVIVDVVVVLSLLIYTAVGAIVTGRKRTRRSSDFLLKEGGKYDGGYS